MEVSYQFVCCGLSFCDEAEKPSEVGLIVMEYIPSCTPISVCWYLGDNIRPYARMTLWLSYLCKYFLRGVDVVLWGPVYGSRSN